MTRYNNDQQDIISNDMCSSLERYQCNHSVSHTRCEQKASAAYFSPILCILHLCVPNRAHHLVFCFPRILAMHAREIILCPIVPECPPSSFCCWPHLCHQVTAVSSHFECNINMEDGRREIIYFLFQFWLTLRQV